MEDMKYMKLAADLAKLGTGKTSPNPIVGAVIVKGNKIIGKGFHEKFGGLHAERNALASCTESTVGATMYVTLTPCCHYGKTPPCTEAIIESGIKKVIIGSEDPNILVKNKSTKILKDAGIEVIENYGKDICDTLNEIFFHYIQSTTPYIALKYAMTMDGKISTFSGKSKWITGPKARERVHLDRNKYSAIMIGIGTAIADDPLLTCRIKNGRNPIRIVVDSKLVLPFESQLIKTAHDIPLIIGTCNKDKETQASYKNYGCKIIEVPSFEGHTDLEFLIKELSKLSIDSILVEGGGTLNWSLLESGLVNKVMTYIAPKIFGGCGQTPVSGKGVESPYDSYILVNQKITHIDSDILIESEVRKCLPE